MIGDCQSTATHMNLPRGKTVEFFGEKNIELLLFPLLDFVAVTRP